MNATLPPDKAAELEEARKMARELRAQWHTMKHGKARREVAEQLDWWENKAAFLANVNWNAGR